MNVLEAALAYASAGWFVIPVKRGSKNPGSIVGGNWPEQSSNHREQIFHWFTDGNHSIALHVGRSGAIVFDVDNPSNLGADLRQALLQDEVPFQSTRNANEFERGHYFFQLPQGLSFGNGLGQLTGGWGDIRCHNGVVLAAPSTHPSADGRYVFQRTGRIPVLPTKIALKLIPRRGDNLPQVTIEEAQNFIDKHVDELYPEKLFQRQLHFLKNPPVPNTRHKLFLNFICLLLKDSAAGFYKASDAIGVASNLFNELKPIEEQTPNEFIKMVLWAVPHAQSMDKAAIALHIYRNAPQLNSELMKWMNSHGK